MSCNEQGNICMLTKLVMSHLVAKNTNDLNQVFSGVSERMLTNRTRSGRGGNKYSLYCNLVSAAAGGRTTESCPLTLLISDALPYKAQCFRPLIIKTIMCMKCSLIPQVHGCNLGKHTICVVCVTEEPQNKPVHKITSQYFLLLDSTLTFLYFSLFVDWFTSKQSHSSSFTPTDSSENCDVI